MRPIILETATRLAFTDAVLRTLKRNPERLSEPLIKSIVKSNESGRGRIHRKRMWHVQRDH